MDPTKAQRECARYHNLLQTGCPANVYYFSFLHLIYLLSPQFVGLRGYNKSSLHYIYIGLPTIIQLFNYF